MDSCGESNESTEPRGGAGGSGGDTVIGKSNHDGRSNDTFLNVFFKKVI